MTAAELHAIYAPLHDAVPETRPKDENNGASGVLDWDDDNGWHLRAQRAESGAWFVAAFYTDRAAAALCRVAAEDWLIPRVYAIRWRQFENGQRTWLNLELTHHDGSFDTFEGDDHHHALVAACFALAEARR